jgi:hypothetical protein
VRSGILSGIIKENERKKMEVKRKEQRTRKKE